MDLDVTTSIDVVFSSDRSGDRSTGKPISQTTGLYYDYQRWYDPSIGRFISQDSNAGYLSDPQSLNPYIYTENTPTSYTDPTGNDPIGFLFGLALGAGIGYGWCVASGGGWLSSQCGWAALGGAAQGGAAGLTDGGSLLVEGGLDAGAGAACEVECSTLSNDLSTNALGDNGLGTNDLGGNALSGSADISVTVTTSSSDTTSIITDTNPAGVSTDIAGTGNLGFSESDSQELQIFAALDRQKSSLRYCKSYYGQRCRYGSRKVTDF